MSALVESLAGVTFLHPWMLLLGLLVPLALGLRARRARASVLFAPASLLDAPDAPLPVSWRVRVTWLPTALQAAGVLLVVVALARPVHRSPLPLRTEGIDVLLCLDVSSSMTANDMDERRTRLEVARDAAARFVGGRPDDRIGLVCFARFPDLRCPPTLDHAALARFLADVVTVASDGPEDATGIGTAVARAAQVLQTSTAKSKVVILLSDGEENVATTQAPGEIAPSHAAQLCAELGVRVYAIAAGAEGPGAAGNRPRIDTRPVERLAERTGGRFYLARDAGAVADVYAAIDALEKVALDEPQYEIEERFLAFVAAAVALALAGRFLGATVLDVLP